MDTTCDHCGALHWFSERLSTSKGEEHLFTSCCAQGDISLDQIREPPTFIRNLLLREDTRSRAFQKDIRRYNNAFAFTSVDCTPTDRNVGRGGPTCFQIHGALYHVTGPLLPRPGEDPKYAQFYIYDPHVAAETRCRLFDGLDREFIQEFSDFVHQYNPFARLYRHAAERLAEAQTQQSQLNNLRIILNPQMRLIVEKGADRRRENLPTADEVAAIIPSEWEDGGKRDVVLAHRTNNGTGYTFSRIPPTHASYMPLAYPLLFPYGDYGFQYGLLLRDRRRINRQRESISVRQFYRYHLFVRSRVSVVPFTYGRLFQQFLVDVWAICDQIKLNWIRNHQSHLRSDLYQGVVDALLRGDVDTTEIGRITVLPASHTGSPRFTARCYQDSMAIVRHLSHPTLFITFTVNPNWVEIKRELLPGQSANDRPDLVARVFHLKCKQLLAEIKTEQIFGKYKGSVYTIEYQKRGLPHMHLIVFLSPEDRNQLLRPEIIDRLISAELPTPETDPDGSLTQVIESSMVHGPCGIDNPDAPCMVSRREGQPKTCSKKFPKLFTEETTVGADGYPIYRRRNNGRSFIKQYKGRDVEFDNRWVVPYCPYLSRRYAAHINIEVCASVRSIKYVHKYIYKGTDRATAEIRTADPNPGRDEVTTYLQGRYIGPSEAVWNLLEFPVHEEWPPVIHLPVHLPGQQPVYFQSEDTEDHVREEIEKQGSALMAFFQYLTDHPNDNTAAGLLYQDFPTEYVYNRKTRKWSKRQRKFEAIGRVYYVPPIAGEKYYLRLLLTSVCGPKSFEDLRTVDGILLPTFHAACISRGLLTDDRDWVTCFEEASGWQTGFQLRLLFVTALVFGSVSDPLQLWIRFQEMLCDDLQQHLERCQFNLPDIVDIHLDYGLFLLQKQLADHSKTLEDFYLPIPVHNWAGIGGNPLINAELTYDTGVEAAFRDDITSRFNQDQAYCFQEIVTAIDRQPEAAHFFLQGPGGTGKTFLYRAVCHHFRSLGRIVLCVASSGIASLLLPGGTTAHSRFRIPLDLHEKSACGVSKSSDLAALLRQVSLIIWDEVPMQHRYCFEAVHRMLTDIRNNDSIFGGIPTVFGGDFAQILPVVKNGNRSSIVAANLQKSFLWNQMRVLTLRQNMRVRPDERNQMFADWLRRLSYDPTLRRKIPVFAGIDRFHQISKLFDEIYPLPLLQAAVSDYSVFQSRAILTTRNEEAVKINEQLIDRFPGELRTYLSSDVAEIDTWSDGDYSEVPATEVLNSFSPASLPLARLRLKIGAPVILLRNLAPKQGMCNGTRLCIISLGSRCLQARILTGQFRGEIRLIPRIKLTSSADELPYIVSRVQFPVRLCFGMTINKSQGQSFDIVGVDLRTPVFTHGQFYVAMSRVTDVNNLAVCLPEEDTSNKVVNIVYPEVLL